MGDGLDFKDLREYSVNDDIRHLNWKATSRSQKPLLNCFDENRQIDIAIIYLKSPTLSALKRRYIKELISALVYITTENGDRVGILSFDKSADSYIPPTSKRASLERFLLSKDKESNSLIDFRLLSKDIKNFFRVKTPLFIIGDFMQEDTDISALSAFGESRVFVIRDRADENLPLGEYLAVDAFGLKKEDIYIDKSVQAKYRKIIKMHDAKLQEHFRKNKVLESKLYTENDAVDSLLTVLR